MDAIRQNIAAAIDIEDNIMSQVMAKLSEIGVTGVEDLREVTLEDLSPGILLPIPARKLMRLWSTRPIEPLTQLLLTPQPSTSSTPATQSCFPTVTPLNSITESPNWHSSFDVSKCLEDMMRNPPTISSKQAAQCLNDGKMLTAAQRNEIVRCVADSIMKVCKTPSRSSINIVAEQLVLKFAKLKDEFDGNVIGPGYVSIRNQIEYRIAYLKRPVSVLKKTTVIKRRLMTTDAQNDDTLNSSRKEKVLRDGYGCVDFLPTDLPDGETEQSLDDKHIALQTIHSSNCWAETEVLNMMNVTYIIQRQDLVGQQLLSVTQMAEKWPFLFHPKGMVQHLTRLLGFNILESFEAGLLRKKPILINFFSHKVSSNKELGNLLSSINEAGQPLVSLIVLVASFFKEDVNMLLRSCEDIPDSSDNYYQSLPETPCIVFQGNELHLATVFRLVVDRHVVCSSISNPITAIALLFGSFFMFNISYPIEASATLEFIQRVVLSINPGKGSKVAKVRGKKARSGPHEAVLSLVKDMAIFEAFDS